MSGVSSRTVAKQILGTGGLQAVGQVASFLGVIAYTQLLPREILGSYFLLVAVLQIASFLGANGVTSDITRRLNQSETPGRELANAVCFTAVVTSALTVGAYLAQPVVAAYVRNQFGLFLVALLPVSVFALLTGAVLRGEQKNTSAETMTACQRVTTYTTGSLALLVGVEPRLALVGGLFSGKLLELGGGLLRIDTVPVGIPRPDELGRLTRRVAKLTVAGMGHLGQQWLDTLLVGVFMTPAAVAVYEVAWRLSAVGLMVTNAVTSVLYPRFAQAASAGDRAAINRYANRAFFYVSSPMVALVAGALALGPMLVTALYGTNYADAYLPLVVLLVGRLPYSLARITTMLSYSYNFDTGVAKASIAAALVNAGLNVALIPTIGITGAALGSLVSYTVLAVLLFELVSDRVDRPQFAQFLPSIAAAGVMFGSVSVLAELLPETVPGLLTLVAVGAVLFSGTLLASSPTLRTDIKHVLPQSE
ncbi:lipopolysaccharide biosynthesis protein [Haloarcula amylovorans]|uniref:lipopolysaccharide biosynthesis protein n=1 Tax=Haloarcula amylovorans TaxID=2562280 RepID=UPI0010761458|nr:polysaccharide biosynthesis C-terminal domain-containing protein [Halomicroarcula amylolytica]